MLHVNRQAIPQIGPVAGEQLHVLLRVAPGDSRLEQDEVDRRPDRDGELREDESSGEHVRPFGLIQSVLLEEQLVWVDEPPSEALRKSYSRHQSPMFDG